MSESGNKDWASQYVLDPLLAPEPSQETGPGTHYTSTFAPAASQASAPSSTHRRSPDKKNGATVSVQEDIAHTYPSPPKSTSPQQSRFKEQFTPSRNSQVTDVSQASTQIPTSTSGGATSTTSGRNRNNSLPSRHPGDTSNRPLDVLRHESVKAHRSPHLRKKHTPGPDSIDTLDTIGASYHHEGPYDATLLSRNTNPYSSPIEAVKGTNAEALKATPPENVQDSLRKHRPLDGTAMVPPGHTDQLGRRYEYEEGTDMMIENGGNYKRWPDMKYHPDDLKGKGEPSFSIERALKQSKRSGHGRHTSEGIEMMTSPRTPQSPRYRDSIDSTRSRPRSAGTDSRPASDGQRYSDWEQGLRRDESGKASGNKLTRRFGSLRRRDH